MTRSSRLTKLLLTSQMYEDLKEMLAQCDFVTLHLPANDEDKGHGKQKSLSVQ